MAAGRADGHPEKGISVCDVTHLERSPGRGVRGAQKMSISLLATLVL